MSRYVSFFLLHLFIFYFMCKGILPACICTMRIPGHEGKKWVSVPLGLELQTAVTCHVDAGNSICQCS